MVPPPHPTHAASPALYLISTSRADVSESVAPILSSRSYAADAGFEHLAIHRPADLEVLRVQSYIICRKQMEVVVTTFLLSGRYIYILDTVMWSDLPSSPESVELWRRRRQPVVIIRVC
jgi:hypothetical protein